jgi:hypothetical protein
LIARLLFAVVALAGGFAHAAASVQPVTPVNVSVAGGETQVFAARFFDALGRPSVGETVRFANDACGTFPNGGFFVEATTDATGLASTTFRAFNQGITCWVVASAGVQVRFDVLTYVAANAYLAATLDPPDPRPGQGFTVTASVRSGAYRIFNADIAARIVPGTGSAAISPGSANSGEQGSVSFSVAPAQLLGEYGIELRFRDAVQRIAVKPRASPWQDLWWAGLGENGWGLSIVQHRDVLFSVIYVYDAAGKATWYVMSGGEWNAARNAYSGSVYAPRGAPYSAYDAKDLAIGAPVGNATLTIADGDHITLDYAIGGVTGRKGITRQFFGPATSVPGADHGDMWWGGPTQNGWGIAVLQQYRSIFAVWFTYDAAGAPTWFVMPAGTWADDATYEGRMYRAAGSPWLGAAYDAAALKVTDVGWFRFRFVEGAARFEYRVDAADGSIPIFRTPF